MHKPTWAKPLPPRCQTRKFIIYRAEDKYPEHVFIWPRCSADILQILCATHFAEQLEEDEVPLLKLGRLLALGGPRETEAPRPAGHHVALHQQLVVCHATTRSGYAALHRFVHGELDQNRDEWVTLPGVKRLLRSLMIALKEGRCEGS